MILESLFINIVTTIIVAALVSFSILGKEWMKVQIGRFELNRRIYKAGITNIYETRDDFAKYRNIPHIAPKLLDYLKLANKNVYISAYWMAYGTEIEGITRGILNLVRPPNNLDITICVINPNTKCIGALSQHMNIPEKELKDRIETSLLKLMQEKDTLSEEEKKKLIIKTHDSLPVASVIILDYGYDEGRIQIEIKPYQVARHYSFALELSGESNGLYKTLSETFYKQINDANTIY